MRINIAPILIVCIVTVSLSLFDIEAANRYLYSLAETSNANIGFGVRDGESMLDISEYRRVKLKKNDDFLQIIGAAYSGAKKTVYIIRNTYDLKGETVDVPKNCVLKFESKGCLRNGTINGSNTCILSKKACFDNVKLTGSFSNSIGHLYWFKKTEDITDQLLSIINKFKTITIDYGGIISEVLPRIDTTSVIDGCGSIVHLYAPSFIWSGTAGQKNFNDIEIKNIIIDYDNNGFNHNNVQAFSIVTHGHISITGVSIINYSNNKGEYSSFEGIAIYPFQDTRVIIKNCCFNNLIVGGDGIVGNQVGSCDGIVVSHYMMNKVDEHTCGSVVIDDCSFDLIQNIGKDGDYILDDASGIAIGMQKDNAYNVSISNCNFKNVSKRNIKIQGNGVKVSNIVTSFDVQKIPPSTTLYCIGSDGRDIIITDVTGNYPAPFFKNSQGNNCVLENVDIEAPELIHIGPDTDYDYLIKKCKISNAKFAVYLSSYKNVSSEYEYTGTPSSGIKIDNCGFENCETFYYTAVGTLNRQQTRVNINNSDISCNTILDGGAGSLNFTNCDINILHKSKPKSVFSPTVNLFLSNTNISVLNNTYRGEEQSYLIQVSHLEAKKCKFSTCDDKPIDVVVSIVPNVEYSEVTYENVIENCLFSIPCSYDLYFGRIFNMPNARIERTSFNNRIRFGNMMDTITLKDVTWKEMAQFDCEESDKSKKDFVIDAENIPYELIPTTAYSYMIKNPSGTWNQRPKKSAVGYKYYCTDKDNDNKIKGIEIYHKGDDIWVDSKGKVVK